MTDRYPDLELYILKPTIEEIADWLKSSFPNYELSVLKHDNNQCQWLISSASSQMQVHLTLAAIKQFASLWFKTNETSWTTDLEAARTLYQHLSKEVRCSDSGWQDGQDEGGQSGWVKINQRGEQHFDWF